MKKPQGKSDFAKFTADLNKRRIAYFIRYENGKTIVTVREWETAFQFDEEGKALK